MINMTTTSYKSNVTGNEAKRNVVRSLAEGTGVDPVAAFNPSSTPVHVSEIKEDGKWISFRVGN